MIGGKSLGGWAAEADDVDDAHRLPVLKVRAESLRVASPRVEYHVYVPCVLLFEVPQLPAATSSIRNVSFKSGDAPRSAGDRTLAVEGYTERWGRAADVNRTVGRQRLSGAERCLGRLILVACRD